MEDATPRSNAESLRSERAGTRASTAAGRSSVARDLVTVALVLTGVGLGGVALLDWLGYTLFVLGAAS